jgi:FkbM family methyltransferase
MGELLRKFGRWLMENPSRRRIYDKAGDLIQRHVRRVLTGPGRGLTFTGGGTPGYVLGLSERAVQDALASHLERGGVFWDVGAHAGFMAVLAGRLVGPEGSVQCFEPVAENIVVLERNLDANKIPKHIHRIALADEDGAGTMKVGAAITAQLADDGVPVTLARGDSLEGVPAPTVVKIDVEGAECRVLDGMGGLLRDGKPVVVVELHKGTGPRVREQLAAAGYSVEKLADHGGMPHLIALPRPVGG